MLASASDDRTVKLWESETGREVHTVNGHINEVNTVAFSRIRVERPVGPRLGPSLRPRGPSVTGPCLPRLRRCV